MLHPGPIPQNSSGLDPASVLAPFPMSTLPTRICSIVALPFVPWIGSDLSVPVITWPGEPGFDGRVPDSPGLVVPSAVPPGDPRPTLHGSLLADPVQTTGAVNLLHRPPGRIGRSRRRKRRPALPDFSCCCILSRSALRRFRHSPPRSGGQPTRIASQRGANRTHGAAHEREQRASAR
jgi:hypothetical protein